jgi:hypothetical protein
MAVDRVAHHIYGTGNHYELVAFVDEDSKQAICVLYNLVRQILTQFSFCCGWIYIAQQPRMSALRPEQPFTHSAASVGLGSKPPFAAKATKVRFGPEAVIAAIASKVRFVPQSRHLGRM